MENPFKVPKPIPEPFRPSIEVQIRDTRKPLHIFQFTVSATVHEFDNEYEDIILDLKEKFEHALVKVFGLQG